MKKYIKPTFEFVQLRMDERLACYCSPTSWWPWPDLSKIFVWTWNWGWHWVPAKKKKSSKQSRGNRWKC